MRHTLLTRTCTGTDIADELKEVEERTVVTDMPQEEALDSTEITKEVALSMYNPANDVVNEVGMERE